MQNGVGSPQTKGLHVEQVPSLRIQRGILPPNGLGAIPFKHTHGNRLGRCKQHVVQSNGPAVKNDLTRPSRIDGKPELNDVQTNVLVK